MKKHFILLASLILFSCSTNKYLLTDLDINKYELKKFISDKVRDHEINKNPVVVLNEKKLTKNELKNLNISSNQISSLSVIKKGNSQMNEIYGNESVNGIIMISTNFEKSKFNKRYSEKSKVLFILDGKIISEVEMKKIKKESIESLTVIKDQKEISKYTEKYYAGIIIIKLKKD